MTSKAHQLVTDRFVAALQEGTVPWRKPWTTTQGDEHRNPFTPTIYSGSNPLMLQLACWQEGYSGNTWGTFRQIKKAKGKLTGAKGKGVPVVFWRFLDSKTKTKADGRPVQIPFLNYSYVFNLQAHTDLTFPEPETKVVEDPNTEADRIFSEIKPEVSISYGHSRAAYAPLTDHIGMPDRAAFCSEAEFQSTRFHEAVHWTGADHRLKRFKPQEGQFSFGSESYSKEELVAELGACFLCNHCGILTDESFENSAAYLQSWIRKLKKDPTLVVNAASKAHKAAQFILGVK